MRNIIKEQTMNKNSSSQFNNQQIVLASNLPSSSHYQGEHVQSSQYIRTAGRLNSQQNALKQRNNSTEATRQIFDAATGIMRQRNSNQQNIASANNNQTFHTSNEQQSAFKNTQSRGLSNGNVMNNSHYGQGYTAKEQEERQKQTMMANQQNHANRQELTSPATNLSAQAGEYQSILLTRYLKEPRLPPSSTYYKGQRNKSKQGPLPQRGTSKNHPQLTQKGHSIVNQLTGGNENNHTFTKETGSPQKNNGVSNNYMESRKSRKRMLPIGSAGGGPKPTEISYRNQNEIMRKIFGNEQNYHQVKSLLVRGPYEGREDQNYVQQASLNAKNQKSPLNQKVMNEYVPQSQSRKPETSPMNSKQKTFSANYEKRLSFNQNNSQVHGTQSPMVGPEEIILAKSHNKNENQFQGPDQSTGLSSQIRSDRIPHPSGNNDQVEKAIFDLQDVKNNYLHEKTLYEQKMQQIQIKQQNQTMTNGFGIPNSNAYNRTATSGFLGTAGNQRPLTQGGLILKNQQLMNDDNVLKGDLEQVTKEDLKERLVVAEMVMKKLFQRNKDLEDQAMANAARKDTSFDTMDQDDPDNKSSNGLPNHKRLSHSIVGSPKNLADLENGDITANGGIHSECGQCMQLRKEITQKEKDMQDRFNELQTQLLKKTEGITKQSHIEYLQLRLEETMAEAKRHFTNYISARNNYNSFLESRLNIGAYQGGTKGQKIQADILNMLKKNLEASEYALIQEKDQLKLSFAKTQAQLLKKDQAIKKRDKQIKELQDEIERRKFIEGKVQRYVKGLISKTQRHSDFLDRLSSLPNPAQFPRLIEDFRKDLETGAAHDGGESTENEEDEVDESRRRKSHVMEDDEDNEEDRRNISVEVNDL